MPIPFSSNALLSAQLPWDARTVVADLTARDAIPTGQRYQGLTVYVVSNATNYQLQVGITNSNWVVAGGGGSSAAGETGITTDYYVDAATGNDSNTGLSGSPWLTIQHAVDAVCSTFYPGKVVIHVADGNYVEALTFTDTFNNPDITDRTALGVSVVEIQGNVTTPALCVIDGTSGTTAGIVNTSNNTVWILNGFDVQADVTLPAILADGCKMFLKNTVSSSALALLKATNGAQVNSSSPDAGSVISSLSDYGVYADLGAIVTISDAPDFEIDTGVAIYGIALYATRDAKIYVFGGFTTNSNLYGFSASLGGKIHFLDSGATAVTTISNAGISAILMDKFGEVQIDANNNFTLATCGTFMSCDVASVIMDNSGANVWTFTGGTPKDVSLSANALAFSDTNFGGCTFGINTGGESYHWAFDARYQVIGNGGAKTAANNMTFPTNSAVYTVNGTTTINLIESASIPAGRQLKLYFSNSLTITHNATGSGSLVPIKCPGSTNLSVVAGTFVVLCLISGPAWQVESVTQP